MAIAGITGHTGRAVAAAVARSNDLRLAAGVSRQAAGQRLPEVVGGGHDGPVFASVDELVAETDCDVMVDYTSADVVLRNVRTAVIAGIRVVVGTSGLSGADYADLDALARAHGVGIIASGNFSIMAALLQRFAVQAAAHLPAWEIIDYADAGKRDVPSGTARALAERLGELGGSAPGLAPDALIGPPEARGAAVAGTNIHSVRLPGYYVSTDIVFATAAERLQIRHDPGTGPEAYVAGTLLAIRRAPEVSGVLRGLDQLLS